MKHYPRKPDARLISLVGRFENMSQSKEQFRFKKSELLLLADYYEFEKFPDKALEVLDFGITQFQKSPDLQLRKTRLLIYNRNFQYVSDLLNKSKALWLKPSQVDLLRVELLIAQDKIKEAHSVLTTLKFRYKKTRRILSDIFYLEALVYEKMNRFDLSFEALSEVLWINNEHQDALGKLWMITELSKRTKDGIALNNYLLQKEHYSAITWFNLGHAYYSEFEYAKAAEAFEFSLTINDDFESAYLDLGEVFMLLGRYKDAAKYLQLAVEKFQINELEVYLLYAESLIKCGEKRRARKILLEGQLLDPFDPDLLYLIGETYRLEGNYESAIQQYHKVLKIDELRDNVHQGLARVYFEMFDFEKAEAHFECAVDYNPTQSDYRIELASLYFNIGELESAEQTLVDAVEEIPDVKLQYYYAAVLMLMNKDQESLDILNEALKEDFQLHEEIFFFAPELEEHPKILAIIKYYQAEQ